jgi:hypothetical protein
MSSGSEQIGGFIRDLGEAARKNPVSAALIGMGVAWMFAGRSQRGSELMRRAGIDRLPEAAQDAWQGTSSHLRSGARSVRETAGDATDMIRSQSGRVVDQMTEAGERLVQSASGYIDELPEHAGNLFDDTKENLTEIFKSHPLAIGAVGVAIGAAMAAAFPTTETEAEYLGEGSEFIKQKASEFTGEQIERASEIGMKVADAVADEARQQGLTPEGLKSAASELSSKATRVAEAATAGSRN